MPDEVIVSIPSKLILAGEHSVCYGKPAIVVAIDRPRMVVTVRRSVGQSRPLFEDKRSDSALNLICEKLDVSLSSVYLNVNSEVPSGSGFGSSGSFCVGCVVALATLFEKGLNKEEILQLSREAEQLLHAGKSSGVDIAAQVYGGLCKYSTEEGVIERFSTKGLSDKFQITEISTNIKRDTAILNCTLREVFRSQETFAEHVMGALSEVTIDLWDILAGIVDKRSVASEEQDKIAVRFKQCHHLLSALGVSHPKLDEIVQMAQTDGIAAKMTGAGGGGCAVMLYEPGSKQAARVIQRLRKGQFTVYENVDLSDRGYLVQSV